MKGAEGGSFGRGGGGRSVSPSPSLSRGGGEGARMGTMTMSRPSGGRIEGGIISQSIARPSNPLRMPTFSPVSRSVPEGPVRGFSFANTKPFSVARPTPEFGRPKVSLDKVGTARPRISLEKNSQQKPGASAEGLNRRIISTPTDVFTKRFQPFVTPKDMSAENGGVQKNISAQGINRLANFDLQPKVSLKKAEVKGATRVGARADSPRKVDVFMGAAILAEAKRKKETDAKLKSKGQQSDAVINQKAEDRVLAQRVREKLFATGVVGSPAEANRIVEKHWIEKYPEEKNVIVPGEQQVLPRIKEQSILDVKKLPDSVNIVRLQAELKQLAEQKTQDGNAVLKSLGISVASSVQEKQQSLTLNGLQVSGAIQQKQKTYSSEQGGAYIMLQKEKELEKKEEYKFAVDEVAQAARENRTQMTAVQKIWGKLYETINPQKTVTGAEIAEALPETAPKDALSKLAQEVGSSHDGSYTEYREMLGKIGKINSVSELMEQERQIRAASPAVERVKESAKTHVGIKDVMRVLIGANDKYGFTK